MRPRRPPTRRSVLPIRLSIRLPKRPPTRPPTRPRNRPPRRTPTRPRNRPPLRPPTQLRNRLPLPPPPRRQRANTAHSSPTRNRAAPAQQPQGKKVDPAATEAYNGYPDRAVIDMSQAQLKSAPEFKYASDPATSATRSTDTTKQ